MTDDKFKNKYRIQSARAAWHDYSGGTYFVTICTKNREHYFGEIVYDQKQEAKMDFSEMVILQKNVLPKWKRCIMILMFPCGL